MRKIFKVKNSLMLAIASFVILTFSGCKKDCDFCYNQGYCNNGVCVCPNGFSGEQCQIDNRPACQRNSTGTVLFNSFSSNPYDCYINSLYVGRVYGYGTLSVTSYSGYCNLRTLQVSGYVLYPSEYTGNGTLSSCGSLTFSFP